MRVLFSSCSPATLFCMYSIRCFPMGKSLVVFNHFWYRLTSLSVLWDKAISRMFTGILNAPPRVGKSYLAIPNF